MADTANPDALSAPKLEAWEAYCDSCGTNRPFTWHEDRDVKDGTLYYEYVCAECFTILMTLQRADPAERAS